MSRGAIGDQRGTDPRPEALPRGPISRSKNRTRFPVASSYTPPPLHTDVCSLSASEAHKHQPVRSGRVHAWEGNSSADRVMAAVHGAIQR